MVQLEQPINPDDHPPQSFELLPAGWYAVTVVAEEVRQSQAGAEYLELTLKVNENYHADHGGRQLFDRLNLWHPKEKVVMIAKSTLSAMATAGGLGVVSDTAQLVGLEIAAKVSIRPAKGDFDAQNGIRTYGSIKEYVDANHGGQVQQQAVSEKPARSSNPPWKK